MTIPGANEPNSSFWGGRRVLLTGHTGFKGTWLAVRLADLGAHIMGLSLPGPHHLPSLWDAISLDITETRADLTCSGCWQDDVHAFAPDVVLHLAAQALVPAAAADPVGTFRTNVMGTAELLAVVSGLVAAPDATLVITTDKVYDVSRQAPYAEGDPLGGKEPYAASKIGAELVVASWPSRLSATATARSGNVIGGGDAAPRRLLPDLVRAWSRDESAQLRMPAAVRPWQHVCEPLDGYLRYVEALATDRGVGLPAALNFGPSPDQHATVEQCVEAAAAAWRDANGARQAPSWSVVADATLKETDELRLDSRLALETLGWRGRWGWREAVERTIAWQVEVTAGLAPVEAVRRDWAAFAEATASH